jgi:hypothetical protein
MSLQSIPELTTSADFSTEESMNLLLASIAFEEFGLAHLINAEADKLKYALGTLKGQPPMKPPVTLEQICMINHSVDQTLRDIIKKELLLQLKLESVLAAKKPPKPCPPSPPCPPFPHNDDCACKCPT